jgi:hypothetical protein
VFLGTLFGGGIVYQLRLLLRFRKSVLCLSLALPLVCAQNPRQPGQLATPDEPLSNSAKFKYRIVENVELRGFLGAAVGASAEQVYHTPREWGKGIEGYGKRYASSFAAALTRQSFDYGFETVLREDPRYFPLDGGSTRARIWSAIKQTFVTRTDSGNTTLAYGRIASAFVTGQIMRAWLPPSTDTFPDGVRTGGLSLGVDAVVNLVYEFVPGSRPAEIKRP